MNSRCIVRSKLTNGLRPRHGSAKGRGHAHTFASTWSFNALTSDLDGTPPAASETPFPRTSAKVDAFSRIVGQPRAKAFLRRISAGVRMGTSPRPILLLGRSGHGKTTLAGAFAKSTDADFVQIECGPELRASELAEQLPSLTPGTVVFCDEMQSLSRRTQEVLYSAIDSNLVPGVEKGRVIRLAPKVPVASLVFIGATNEPGRLLPALRGRMMIVRLDEYSGDELRSMVRQKSRGLLLGLTPGAVDLVAQCSGGSPRLIDQILQTLEITAASERVMELPTGDAMPAGNIADLTGAPLVPNAALPGASHSAVIEVSDECVVEVLDFLGLDGAGLDATGRLIISTIATHGWAATDLVAAVLGLDRVYAREQLAALRARGFVQAQAGRGWMLTESGKTLAEDLGLAA